VSITVRKDQNWYTTTTRKECAYVRKIVGPVFDSVFRSFLHSIREDVGTLS
jgi:hypothetical protein